VTQPTGLLAEIEQLYRADGLTVPYIPAEMLPKLEKLSPAIFGTRRDTPPPYALHLFAIEVATKPTEDYLIFGHDGHGTNSWAIHYYLVRGPLALFLQISWGGAYGDKGGDTGRVNRKLAQAAELAHAVEAAQEQGKFKPGQRLFVADSDFYGQRWGFLEKVYTVEEYRQVDANWHEDKDPLQAALAALNDL
jgi:hypothetical protein